MNFLPYLVTRYVLSLGNVRWDSRHGTPSQDQTCIWLKPSGRVTCLQLFWCIQICSHHTEGYACASPTWWGTATPSSPSTSMKCCIAWLHWKTSELQEQRLSSPHPADTFLILFYLLFITFPFPKSQCWQALVVSLMKILLLSSNAFYTAGYEQCNCFSTGNVPFYGFEVCPAQSNSDAYRASRASCNIIT